MIALITPTGARPDQIRLCSKFMKAQTIKDVVWIIVDDALPRSTDFIKEDFKEGWTIEKIYPEPFWQFGQNTQGRNIAAAMQRVKELNPDAIFIIEDDDYYSPTYIEKMLVKLQGYDLAGERNTIYYNVRLRRWCRNGNALWSSLFQTAFTMAVVPVFEKLYGEKFIDLELFKNIRNKNLFNDGDYGIGIKGQPGRAGIGAGHGWIRNMIPDPDMSKLREFIGEDYKYYERAYRYL